GEVMTIVAYNYSTGQQTWNVSIPGERVPSSGAPLFIVTKKGQIVLCTQSETTGNLSLFGINSLSGAIVYNVSLGSAESSLVASGMVFNPVYGHVVVPIQDSVLTVDPSSGKVLGQVKSTYGLLNEDQLFLDASGRIGVSRWIPDDDWAVSGWAL